MSERQSTTQTAAQLLVRSLERQNVKYTFGIPGGKIMPTFDVLNDEGPELIVCRHEQNAAFITAAVGRLTGRPGVCLVTSGPGTGNLVTGAATATTEGVFYQLRSDGSARPVAPEQKTPFAVVTFFQPEKELDLPRDIAKKGAARIDRKRNRCESVYSTKSRWCFRRGSHADRSRSTQAISSAHPGNGTSGREDFFECRRYVGGLSNPFLRTRHWSRRLPSSLSEKGQTGRRACSGLPASHQQSSDLYAAWFSCRIADFGRFPQGQIRRQIPRPTDQSQRRIEHGGK